MARDQIVMRFAKVEGGVIAHRYARASPVSLSRKTLNPVPEAAQNKNKNKTKTKQGYQFCARSFIAKHGVLLLYYVLGMCHLLCIIY